MQASFRNIALEEFLRNRKPSSRRGAGHRLYIATEGGTLRTLVAVVHFVACAAPSYLLRDNARPIHGLGVNVRYLAGFPRGIRGRGA